MNTAPSCAWCRRPLAWLHGHGACLDGSCQMFGINQDECCSGASTWSGVCPAASADPAPR